MVTRFTVDGAGRFQPRYTGNSESHMIGSQGHNSASFWRLTPVKFSDSTPEHIAVNYNQATLAEYRLFWDSTLLES